jgi:hypothetical protein
VVVMVENNSSNIFYLKNNQQAAPVIRPEPELPLASCAGLDGQPEQPFQAIILKNRQNRIRLQQDRLKANRSVLKSYRLK